MKNTRNILVAMLVACLLVVSGCVYTPIQVAPVSIEPGARVDAFKFKRVGEACEHRILYIIPVGDNRINTAMKEIIGSKWDLAIITVEEKFLPWILGTTRCTIVTGYRQLEDKKKKKENLGDENSPN